MEWKWNYGQGVLTLPAAVLETDATPQQLRILLWIASDPTLFSKPAQLAKLAGCEREEVGEILQFWQDCGILSRGDATNPASRTKRVQTRAATSPKSGPTPAKAEKPTPRPAVQTLARADELPTYTTEQLTELLERNRALRTLIDEAQNVWGKVFIPYEVQLLVGLSEFLRLDDEYILLLLAHCKRIGKKSLRAVERYAIGLADSGVTDAAALEDYVCRAEARQTLQGKVREMFGMGARDLTGKESKMLDAWISYGYGEDIIRRAYEITVGATNSPSIPYTNAILERWHTEGLNTAEEIDAAIMAEKEKKGTAPKQGSFDTDDFFEAALARSYSDDAECPDGGKHGI